MSYKLRLAAALLACFVAFGGLGGIGLMSMASAQPAGVKINEVELNPRGRDAGGEWVEIYNPTGADVNIGDYKIKTSWGSNSITIPAGTVLGGGQLYVLAIEGQKLSNRDLLTLTDSAGQVIDKTASLMDQKDNSLTLQRFPDGGSNWRFIDGTKGTPNDPTTFANVKLSSSVDNGQNSSGSTAQQSNIGECVGSAMCLQGIVVRVHDADTVYVRSGSNLYIINLSLTKAIGNDRSFTQTLCSGNSAIVDQDDKQPGRGKSIMGVVYCSSANLNQQLLDSGHVTLDSRQCATSEFASHDWAKRHGCQ